MAKMVVLDLEGLSPELVAKWSAKLPNLIKMQCDGIWGKLLSTIPPTTPVACTCAQVGRNPGAFGFWDDCFRDSFSYNEARQVNSESIKVEPIYKLLPKMAQKVAIINVPLTWPTPAIPSGYSIGSPATPNTLNLMCPEALKDEIHHLVGDYILDIFTSEMTNNDVNEDKILKRIKETDSQRFKLLPHFVNEKQCDYVFTVVRGIDRLAHLFYRHFDERHVHHDPASKYACILKEYYAFIDEKIGEVRASLPTHTALLVYSDYSVQRLDGQVNINEWLVQEGYLTLSEYPSEPTVLSNCKVDWLRTKAWSTGSTGQIYINLKGREAQGIVELANYDNLIDELTGKLAALTNEHGNRLNTKVFRRDDIHFGSYAKYEPDVFICFDEYHWNTNENLGHGKGGLYSYDIGNRRDDATHGLYGYFCMAGTDVLQKGEISGISLLNIAPTVLDLMGVDIPYEMEGVSILTIAQEEIGMPYYRKHEEAIKGRLEALGY